MGVISQSDCLGSRRERGRTDIPVCLCMVHAGNEVGQTFLTVGLCMVHAGNEVGQTFLSVFASVHAGKERQRGLVNRSCVMHERGTQRGRGPQPKERITNLYAATSRSDPAGFRPGSQRREDAKTQRKQIFFAPSRLCAFAPSRLRAFAPSRLRGRGPAARPSRQVV
jgi:hypothetical protein